MFSRFVSRFLFIVFASLFAGTANADSILHITQAEVFIGPNQGFGGDNVLSFFGGPGVFIFGGGGAGCQFCDASSQFLPGQSLSGFVPFIAPLNFVFNFTWRGTSYDVNDVIFGSSSIMSGDFTFPVGRKSPFVFTVKLPALFEDVHGQILSTGETLTLAIPPGMMFLDFDFTPGTAGDPSFYTYSGGEFVTVPEPNTFLMLGTGLLGAWRARRIILQRSQGRP